MLCCVVSGYGVKSRLSYDKITVEWKGSYHVTNRQKYFLAVNTFYGATPISLEQGTDEMVFGMDAGGILYEWREGLDAYEMELPYHQAEIGAVSQSEERSVLAVTARRAMTNFEVTYVAVLRDRSGAELARATQAQTDNRLWLDFLLDNPVSGVYSITFELSDGSVAYIQDGLQVGYILRIQLYNNEGYMKKVWTLFIGFCRVCLQWVAKPFHIEITDASWDVWEQFIKFVLVGCSNAVVTLLVYDAMVIAFDEEIYLIGQTVGYVAGILNSYFWNSRFVFAAKEIKQSQSFVKMCTCYGMTYFMQMGMLYLFVEKLAISAFVAPVLAIIITTPVNFIINKFWAFSE